MDKIRNIKVVAFDADDTLWVNEPFFRSAEAQYFKILERYLPGEDFSKELYANELKNLKLFGYGAKGFMLSMIETALELTHNAICGEDIQRIIDLGKEILTYKIELYDGVEEVLNYLRESYKVICVTKGDLLDQESKIARSGLGRHFFDLKIVSDKNNSTYKEIIRELEIMPCEFIMIGNSLKSDILPVCDIGAHAIYIPREMPWQHEVVDEATIENKQYIKAFELLEIKKYL